VNSRSCMEPLTGNNMYHEAFAIGLVLGLGLVVVNSRVDI